MNHVRRSFIKKLLNGILPVFTISPSVFFLNVKRMEKSEVTKQDKSMIIREISHDGAFDISAAENLLERQAKFQLIETINWSQYSYKPKVKFKIAHCQGHILLKYYVEEASVKAAVSTINGSVHKDSCVEFFISLHPNGPYYNFEFNCIGIPHVEHGYSRHERKPIDPKILKSIQSKSTLGTLPFEEKVGDQKWELMLTIPSSCFAHDPDLDFNRLDARANFYKCADDTIKPHYVTWNPIKTEKPDYHQPKYFGKVEFE